MTNSAEFAAAFLACVWLGAIPVLQNSQFGRSELEHIVALCEPALFLLSEQCAYDPATAGLRHARARVRRRHRQVCAPRTAEQARIEVAAPASFRCRPQCSRLHRLHVRHHRQAERRRARSPLARRARRQQPRARSAATGRRHARNRRVELHQRARPQRAVSAAQRRHRRDHGGSRQPERILQTIERDRVTLLHSVATLYRRILGTAGIENRYDLRSLRGANSTGEPLEDAVRDEWEARIGCPIWEHYGISEAQMVIGDGPGIPKREGSVGRTWGARAAVLDDELNALPAGSVGTLAFGV